MGSKDLGKFGLFELVDILMETPDPPDFLYAKRRT